MSAVIQMMIADAESLYAVVEYGIDRRIVGHEEFTDTGKHQRVPAPLEKHAVVGGDEHVGREGGGDDDMLGGERGIVHHLCRPVVLQHIQSVIQRREIDMGISVSLKDGRNILISERRERVGPAVAIYHHQPVLQADHELLRTIVRIDMQCRHLGFRGEQFFLKRREVVAPKLSAEGDAIDPPLVVQIEESTLVTSATDDGVALDKVEDLVGMRPALVNMIDVIPRINEIERSLVLTRSHHRMVGTIHGQMRWYFPDRMVGNHPDIVVTGGIREDMGRFLRDGSAQGDMGEMAEIIREIGFVDAEEGHRIP